VVVVLSHIVCQLYIVVIVIFIIIIIIILGDPASQSTPIRWKEGNDLTKKGKDKNVGKGRKRAMEQKTFFNWFTDHGDPSADDIAEVMFLTCEIQQYQYVGDRPLYEVYLIYLYLLFWELALFPS
jgi:hypothetical protein